MDKQLDYAWAAGFWDGEGNVSLTYRRYSENTAETPRIVIQVAQVDRRVLDKFHTVMESGRVNGPYAPKTKNSSPYYCWRLEGVPHLHEFRQKLAPYLGEAKLEQIDRALEARRVWEETATCGLGHRLSKSPKGHWRCFDCQSRQGKLNTATRWGKERSGESIG